MAKDQLVAKVRFDDGSKVGGDGKSKDYEVGEEYQGEDKAAAKAKTAGFVCKESELIASKEVLDEKDKEIRALKAEAAALKVKAEGKDSAALEKLVEELQVENAELKEKLAKKKG